MQINRIAGSAFLLAGTSIGAGMLALPVATAKAGLGLSLVLLALGWLVFYGCGLLVLQVNLWFEAGTNFVKMSRYTLGRKGEAVTWLIYLLLLYSLIAAYLTGGADLLSQALTQITGFRLHAVVSSSLWLLLIGIIIWCGPWLVDYANRVFLTILAGGYVALLSIAGSHIHLSKTFAHASGYPETLIAALPVIATSFGFHIIIPTVRVYLRSQVKDLKLVLLIGSLIPFCVYALWDIIIFNLLPISGEHSLASIARDGGHISDLAKALSHFVTSPWLVHTVKLFTFAALASSFLGVSTALYDFVADGLHIHKSRQGRGVLMLVTFAPPALYVWLWPQGFVMALSYAGIFVALLHCVLPVWMVLKGRRLYSAHIINLPTYILYLLLLFAVAVIIGRGIA